MSSLARFVRHSALWVIALMLVTIVSSTGAKADSIKYHFHGTFSDGFSLSGTYDWDTDLNAATGYVFNLSDTIGPATCSDPFGSCTFFSEADFEGSGAYSGTYEAVLSLLDPDNPIFVLGVYDAGFNLLDAPDPLTPSPSSSQVPEPSTFSTVFIALIMLMLAATFRRAQWSDTARIFRS
jgi:hypothetical protein